MDFDLFLLCLSFGTLWHNVYLEKLPRSIDSFIPFVIKPFDDKEGKVASKDFALKTGTILPSGGKITNQDIANLKTRFRQPNNRDNLKKGLIDDHDLVDHDPTTCPECQSLERESKSDEKVTKNEVPELRENRQVLKDPLNTATDTKNFADKEPEDDKVVKVADSPKFKQMTILKPYILHAEAFNDAVKKVSKILTSKTGSTLPESKTDQNNKTEQNLNVGKETTPTVISENRRMNNNAVNPINWATTAPFNQKIVKIENDYHMKEYQEIYEPYYIYFASNPYSQNGYCYLNQNNWYANNGYSWYPNNSRVYKKIWRNVIQTSKRNGEVFNRRFVSYSPTMFNNNWYSTRPCPITGYSYYNSPNIR